MHACDGEFSAAMALHDAALGRPAVLIWAEAVADLQTARMAASRIEALDDVRYFQLLKGEAEVGQI